MSDSYGKRVAIYKGALVWILATLSVCELTLMKDSDIDKTVFKIILYLMVKDTKSDSF